jgi:hypothetical protein
MWRHGEIAILDFEKCFGHLALAEESEKPWREFLNLRPFRTHSLRACAKDVENREFGRPLRENLVELEMNNRLPELIRFAQTAFPDAELELNRVLRYFELLNKNTPDFFDYLRLSIER